MRFRSWVIVLAAGLCGCGKGKEPASQIEERALTDDAEGRTVAAIKKLGGWVKQDETVAGKSFVVVLEGAIVTDTVLKELAPLKGLKTLSLRNTEVTDVGLKELAQLKSLAFLNIADTKVTDAGLKELAALKTLTSISMYRTKVTEAGVADLKKALPGCKITIPNH
jgi:internalin A